MRRYSCLLWPCALALLLQRLATGHQLRRFAAATGGAADAGGHGESPALTWAGAAQGPLSNKEVRGVAEVRRRGRVV